jgi:hypothetical protein
MGVVYRARHVGHGREVALKVLAGELGSDPEFIDRFQREGRLQASLEHPHVVTVYEAGESEHGLYLAMRLVPGSTLAALMRERQLDARRALAVLRQAAGGLDAAHAAGLVHRDVKPQNVLVGDDDDAYLADFGLTRVGGAEGVTATGKLFGTVSYLAPEVIEGGEATPASDRYAFAAMVFEALTGTAVHPRPNEAAVLHAHTSEPPPPLSRRRPELPPALDELFARALAKNPRERPKSVTGLVDSVAATLDDAGLAELGPPPPRGVAGLEGPTIEPVRPAGAPARPAERQRRMVPALLLAVLLGAGSAAGIAALVDDDAAGTAAAVPPPLRGAQVIGSDLADPGRALDCRGRAPRPSSPSCTIVQAELPGRTLVVPKDGVIRRWAVRSARGELGLVVLRPRGDVAKQVGRSENEFVENGRVHLFKTDLAVRQGDLVGMVAVAGSAVGARTGVDGASTRRWIPILFGGEQPPDHGPASGFDHELLLRVEYVPGGEPRRPRQISGAAAARLEPGRVRVERTLRYASGRLATIKLVRLGDHFVFDQFVGGRRTARIDLPDFLPGEGNIIELEVYAEEDAEQIGVYIEFVNPESERIQKHFYDVFPREFTFIL